MENTEWICLTQPLPKKLVDLGYYYAEVPKSSKLESTPTGSFAELVDFWSKSNA